MSPVTAIVVAFDSAHVLPACLDALRREDVPAIVVDNASEDGSAEMAEAHGARVIRNARNEGYGRAN
ncbi:MAG TPA: glycosyltransferase, partial [Beijerinckiaceae bacterium]|nr:glycosyltransferase [Beijerinckiaceae bacterium]